jgi:hypothetical protein
MISIWTLDKPYKDIRDERGTTRAWLPCSDVVVLSSTEHQTPYMMREITYVLDEGIRRAKKDGREKIVIFCDWYDLISYDTEARRVAAEWGERNKEHVSNIHISTRSVMFRMAIAVVNIAFRGNIVTHHSPKSLEKAAIRYMAERK